VILRLSFALVLTVHLSAGGPARPPDEYQVKAAFLYNFARFIEWPAEVFRDPNDPFVICVLGEDPFGRALDDVVSGKKIDGRGFTVRRISEARRATGCMILFVSSTERKPVLSTLGSLNQSGVLTVGETDNATSDGMIINLMLQDGKVRFEIDMDAAEKERLRFSSKLLSLATVVKK
jgi:hypothetical protein